MGGILGGGGGTVNTADSRIGSIAITQSTYGIAVPVIFGTNRVAGNMIDYVNFTAIPHTTTTTSGGKGGGGVTSSNTTYTYEVATIFSLGEGPAQAVKRIWKDKSVYGTPGELRFTPFLGTADQQPWPWMKGAHPERALNYPNTIYVASPNMELSSSAGVPTFSFEVAGRNIANGHADARPVDIITAILYDPQIGVGFPAENMGDIESFRNYCIANGVYFSPAYESQEEAQELITQLLQASNSAPVWSQGKLKLIPYGLETITANGVTYTPPTAPLYDITLDDIVYAEGEAPIVIKPNLTADRYNVQSVEILNRNNDYNVEPVKATDDADISQRGTRPADSIEMHFITLPEVAQFAAQSILQRKLYVAAQYEFTLTWRHCLLDPMDVVTLTDPFLGLDKQPVRIISIEEDEEYNLKVTAEDCPEGVNSPTVYTTQAASRPSMDYNAAPPDINEPVLFEPPAQVAESMTICVAVSGKNNLWGGCNVWASYEDATYKKIGTVTNPARHGKLTGSFPAGYSHDTQNVMPVDVSVSRAELLTATDADATNHNTLCWVGGELVAYQEADLVGPCRYNLRNLQRGVYGTEIKTHLENSKFVRIDDAVLKYKYRAEDVGKKFYLKFTSFNCFGNAEQSLDDVDPYVYTIEGADVIDQPQFSVTQSGESLTAVLSMAINSTNNTYYTYELRMGPTWGTSTFIDRFTSSTYTFRAPSEGTLTFWIKAIDSKGNYSKDAGRAIVSVVDLPVRNIIYERTEDMSTWAIKDIWKDLDGAYRIRACKRLGDYAHFADIFGRKLLLVDSSEIVFPIIDLGPNILDESCYYVGPDGTLKIHNKEKLGDYAHFADIFGAVLTPKTPEYVKETFVGVTVDYKTIGSAYVDIQYRASLDGNNWSDLKPLAQKQFIGGYAEIHLFPHSADGSGQIVISGAAVSIDVPDIEDIIESKDIPAARTRIYYHKKFSAVKSIAPYTQDGTGMQATCWIVEQTTEYFDIEILNASGTMIAGKLQKAVIRGY